MKTLILREIQKNNNPKLYYSNPEKFKRSYPIKKQTLELFDNNKNLILKNWPYINKKDEEVEEEKEEELK